MRRQHKYNDDVEASKKSKKPQIWTLIYRFYLQTNNTNTNRKAKTSTTKKPTDSRKITEAKIKMLLGEEKKSFSRRLVVDDDGGEKI